MLKQTIDVALRVTIKVETTKTVKVKSYTRVRNGRIEKVRAHIRKY